MARLASRSKLTVLATALVVSYAAGLVAYLLSLLQPVQEAEQGTLDWRFLFRGPMGEKPAEIALVTVDEQADLPYWAPVPREHLARVIESLTRGGAKLVGLDFYLGSRSFDAAGDSLLREAMLRAGNVVPVSFLERGEDGALKEYRAMPYFLEAALDYGYATFFTGTGVESVREGRVAIGIDGQHALSLAGALYARARGLETGEIRELDWSRRYDRLPGSDDDYRRLIDYNGPPFQYYRGLDHELVGGIAAFSSKQVASLPPVLAQRFFKDRIVLVGSGLSDAPDIYRTPFFSQRYDYERTFGVEIHAQFLHSLLAERPLAEVGSFAAILLVLIPGFLAGLAAVRLRPYLALPLVLVVLALVWGLGFHLFGAYQLVVPLVMPTLASGLACLFGLIYVGSTDGRRKNAVRDRFAPMVGERYLAQLLEAPDAWATDGDERLVTVLWLQLELDDSVRRSPRETMAFFQDYWRRMTPLIFENDGVVFVYEERGLGAVFGAPLAQKDHAQRAVTTAIDVAEAWLSFGKGAQTEKGRLAIGLETGTALIGELGADERFSYRVLGTPVDRACELAMSQDGRGEIRISRQLQEQVAELVESEPVDGDVFRLTGRLSAPPIGAAETPTSPFWKYLKLERGGEENISDELLERLAIFAEFNRRDLHHVKPLLFHRSFRPGERIFAQGEVGSAMYIIQRGSVDILHEEEEEEAGDPHLLQRLGEGEFFGELALLSDLPRPASAVAYQKAELLVLFQNDLFDLIEQQPELGVRLIRSLSRITGERLVRANEELVRRNNGREVEAVAP